MTGLDLAPRISTERLRLRRPEPWRTRPPSPSWRTTIAVSGNTTRMPFPYRPADARAFIALARGLDPREQITFAIEHRDAGVIGALGFHRRRRAGAGAGLLAGPALLGQGLGDRSGPRSAAVGARAIGVAG